MLSHSNGVPAGMRGEVHTDNQGLWTQSSLQVPFSIRTLISNQSFGFSLNTLCLLLPQNFRPSSPFYLHHPSPDFASLASSHCSAFIRNVTNSEEKVLLPFSMLASPLCSSASLVYFWVLFFTLFCFSTCSAECHVPSLYLPPPALNMNSGAHSCPCRGLGIECFMHSY